MSIAVGFNNYYTINKHCTGVTKPNAHLNVNIELNVKKEYEKYDKNPVNFSGFFNKKLLK